MLCTGLFPNADTKIQHRRRPTCPLWYDKYQLCSIWLNYVYFCTQAYAAEYSSGSINLLKWLNQLTLLPLHPETSSNELVNGC